MGRRWGKTVLGGTLAMATASQGGKVAWTVPIYKNGRAPWRWIETTLSEVKRAGLCSINRSERHVEFENGGYFGLYSMDNEDSIRGEAFHLVILDEAAKMSETAWTDAIQPTLADYGGEAMLISTPRGRNWFWAEYQRGLSGGEIASFHAPSSDNPNPMIKRAALMARERIPERSYRQEWLAEFVDDSGGVFRRVVEAATAQRHDDPVSGHTYVIGVDWGKSNDYTVISVLDATTCEQVYFDRFNQIDYHVQLPRLYAVCDRFHPAAVIPEINSIGAPLVEEIMRKGYPVYPFQTTNASKAEIIDALALAFENGSIKILNEPVQVGELQSYEMERLPSGMMRYSAPSGMHDDTVMALALSLYAAQQHSQSIIAFTV